VTQSFTLSLSDALQTFTFGPGFTNLLPVTFVQDGLTSQFDNIVVGTSSAVPEPGTVALLVGMMSVGGIVLRRGRR